MRDDDDDIPDDDEPLGRLYRSGIQRESEVEPADYALTPGMAALEGEVVEHVVEQAVEQAVEQEDHQRKEETQPVGALDRRRAMAIAAGCLAAGSGLFGLGILISNNESEPGGDDLWRSTRLTADQLRRIDIARQWADKPIDVLVGSVSSFLWTLHHVEPDESLRRGLRRLCEFAHSRRNERGYKVAVKVLATFEEVGVPLGFEHYVQSLGEVVWRWQVSRETRDK